MISSIHVATIIAEESKELSELSNQRAIQFEEDRQQPHTEVLHQRQAIVLVPFRQHFQRIGIVKVEQFAPVDGQEHFVLGIGHHVVDLHTSDRLG